MIHVAYSSNGEGRFRALEGANPFIGEVDEIEVADGRKNRSRIPCNP